MIRRLFAVLLALSLIAVACGSTADTAAETVEEAVTDEADEGDAEEEEAMEDEEEGDAEEEEAMEDEEEGEAEEAPAEFQDVTMLVVNNMAHLPAFVANEFGLWPDRGLNVDLQTLGSGADIAAGLQSGQAEFGAVNAGTGVAPQRASGLLTKLIAPYNNDATNAQYVDWIHIVGRADSGISADPADFAGQTIGVTGGGTPRAYLTAFLGQLGLTDDDIEVVVLGVGDMIPEILAGNVDAIVPFSPFHESALRQLGDNGVIVSEGEPLVSSQIGLGAVDGQLEADPDTFRAFIEGLVEAAYIVRTDQEAAAEVVLSFIEGITLEDAIAALNNNTYDPRVSVCVEYGVAQTAADLIESGAVESDTPFTADDLIDASLLNEVLEANPQWIEDLPPLPETVEECSGVGG